MGFVQKIKLFAAFIRWNWIATKASLNHQQKDKHAKHGTDQRLVQIFAFKLYFKHYKA